VKNAKKKQKRKWGKRGGGKTPSSQVRKETVDFQNNDNRKGKIKMGILSSLDLGAQRNRRRENGEKRTTKTRGEKGTNRHGANEKDGKTINSKDGEPLGVLGRRKEN